MKNTLANPLHEPVLLNETCENLHITRKGKFIDATLGAAGHTIEILRRGGQVLGLDQDESMLEIAEENLKDFCAKHACPSFKLIHSNFNNIDVVAKNNNFPSVDGILMDLGVSSIHFDDKSRGFSFRYPDADLDMRLDFSKALKAKDILNLSSQKDLVNIFGSRALAKRIVNKRKHKAFERVSDFLSLFPERLAKKTHPATKAFMDLRIAVNAELDVVRQAIPKAADLLNKGGRLCIITFHSGEDRIVKRIFKELETDADSLRIITNKPITPTQHEMDTNPKSRSAKLRVLEKTQ